jgi:3-methyladenine DNA glycosylase Tag
LSEESGQTVKPKDKASFLKSVIDFLNSGILKNTTEIKILNRMHLKKVDQGSEQGAVWRKSGAYTIVFEHFEPNRNAAMST